MLSARLNNNEVNTFQKHFEVISSLIDNDYIFIDLPYYSNIGDTLIWKGTEDFLRYSPYHCLLRSSFQTFRYPELSKDVVILMQGGGNWGDLYFAHNEFRKNVIKHYPDNKIIILPQTIFYESATQARVDAGVFRQHKSLTICARDGYSYRFLKAFGFGEDVRIVPDMAFCIDSENLIRYAKPSSHRDLLFQRVDKENTDVGIAKELANDYDISDWPGYENSEPMVEYLYTLIEKGKFQEADDYAVNTYLPARIKTGVELISRYDRVFSNRLHGSILSILLGKEVCMLDNSYGKNSHYYNTWLKNNERVHLLTSSRTLNLTREIRFFVRWLQSIFDRIKG